MTGLRRTFALGLIALAAIGTLSVQPTIAQQDLISKDDAAALTGEQINYLDTTVQGFIDKNEFADGIRFIIFVQRNNSDADIRQWCSDTMKQLGQLRREWRKAEKAYEVLDEKPEDEQANVVVGKFQLLKGNWDEAILRLSFGGDDDMAKLARLTEQAHDAETKLKVANDWFENEHDFPVARTKALEMYKALLPELKGLDKMRVEKQLASIKRELGPRKIGDTWENSSGMSFAYIPAGQFVMGSPRGETGREEDEEAFRVRITEPFLLQTTEVTQDQWIKVMGMNPSRHSGNGKNPVDNVSWSDAVTFCKKLSALDGKQYRLPTEAEWEYACRAGTRTAYQWGNQWQLGVCNAENATGTPEDGNVQNFRQRGFPVNSTMPVASFAANAWGLYDMHGNLWEWCYDWYGPYPGRSTTNPQGPNGGEFRVHRGGSWVDFPRRCRSAERDRNTIDFKQHNVGFRVLLVLD